MLEARRKSQDARTKIQEPRRCGAGLLVYFLLPGFMVQGLKFKVQPQTWNLKLQTAFSDLRSLTFWFLQ